MWKSCGYPVIDIQLQKLQSLLMFVIGHPRYHTAIKWKIGTWRIDHDQEFYYRYNKYLTKNMLLLIMEHD